MKRTLLASLSAAAVLSGSVAFAGVALAGGTSDASTSPTPCPSAPAKPGTATPTATAPTASAALKAELIYMREEERLARDVYAALAKKYDNALPFSRIVTSEQRHFEAVGTLLTRYGIADPSAGRAAGKYASPELQAMYDKLMKQGSTSLAQAYQVGITIEKTDISDLQKAMDAFAQPDVDRVFGNLLDASKQHLAAFERAAAGNLQDCAGDGTGPGAQGRTPGKGQGANNGQGNAYGKGQGQGAQNGKGVQNRAPQAQQNAQGPKGQRQQDGDCDRPKAQQRQQDGDCDGTGVAKNQGQQKRGGGQSQGKNRAAQDCPNA